MYIVSTTGTEKFSNNMLINKKLKKTIVDRKKFPDGEFYIRVLEDLKNKDVVVTGNTRDPAEFLEFSFLLDAVREQKPEKITAIVPYFGYARQHMIYKSGEAISAKVIIKQISEYADKIVTVDIHDESAYKYSGAQCKDFHASTSVANYYRDKGIDLVMAPDDGAYERAKEVGNALGCKSSFLNKKRIDATTVHYDMKNIDSSDLNVLIVDDIISTGGTILRSADLIKKSGAKNIYVSATHGLFINESDKKIAAICQELAVSDTIDSKYSKIKVSNRLSNYITGDYDGEKFEELPH
jgi:ribose-phosphate pyrophosphokinase